ncbi:hypothetical protein CNR22_05510 [Sphingobacteriaceae bacterium]|nr:hypothetical protein CNR22_05510 [Sphingobacteriaceae bacterium]
MKKALLFVAALILLSAITNAKDGNNPIKFKNGTGKNGTCFDESTHLLNVGIGFGFATYRSYGLGGGYSYGSSPLISVSYEQGWKKKLGPGYLGVGGFASFRTSHSRYDNYYYKNERYYYEHRWNYLTFAARGIYHWDVLNTKNAEVYGGMLIGFRVTTYKYSSNSTDPDTQLYQRSDGGVMPVASFIAGARWYFVPKVALFGEAVGGVGTSFISGGVTFKW